MNSRASVEEIVGARRLKSVKSKTEIPRTLDSIGLADKVNFRKSLVTERLFTSESAP